MLHGQRGIGMFDHKLCDSGQISFQKCRGGHRCPSHVIIGGNTKPILTWEA